jgi:death-on-curing protein
VTVWLSHQLILAIHDEQLAEHGGALGTRDDGLLASALARPLNRPGYGDPDIAELASLYAIAIARNRPFVDGNKRTAYVALKIFILLNGCGFPVGSMPLSTCCKSRQGISATTRSSPGFVAS